MHIQGSRVGIVGGSIAGCAAAIALQRSGCEVTIFEQTQSSLRDRGFGITLPVPLRLELETAGYLDVTVPMRLTTERLWMVRDGETPLGRTAWRQPYAGAVHNWGILWQTLRRRLADTVCWRSVSVIEVKEDAEGVTVVADRRGLHRFDLVVGADGHQSVVRPHIDPESRPSYAGYLLWRGSYSTDRLTGKPPRAMGHGAVVTVVFPGGHAVFSLIPDLRGRERINWGIYCTIPGVELGEPGPMPPGSIGPDLRRGLDRLLDAHFPPYWADVVRSTPRHELSIQPIYDATVSAYVSRRMLLIGDAGTITRPHTAAGATRALHEALSLERICAENTGWPGALAAYDAQRCASASALVELGRSLGGAQVEHTPPWSSMSQLDFEDWMRATVADHAGHYRV